MLMARPSSCAGELVAEDLHVAGQDHQFHVELVHQFQQPGFGRGLGVGGDRHVEERDAVPLDQRLVVRVVGDHGHDLHRQFPDAGPEQQVVEAVPELGHHDQHPALAAVRLQLPAHPEPLGHRARSPPRSVPPWRHRPRRTAKCTRMKKCRFGAFAELLAVEDVAAVLQQEAGDGVDDARALRAVQGQDVLNGGRPGRRRFQSGWQSWLSTRSRSRRGPRGRFPCTWSSCPLLSRAWS